VRSRRFSTRVLKKGKSRLGTTAKLLSQPKKEGIRSPTGPREKEDGNGRREEDQVRTAGWRRRGLSFSASAAKHSGCLQLQGL